MSLGNYKSLNYVNKVVMYIDKLNLSYPFLLIPLANLFFKLFNNKNNKIIPSK